MSLKAIHWARRELGLADAEYRAILREVAGVDSAKYLDAAGDRAVMARLCALRDERRGAAPKRVKTPTERKIWRLWLGDEDDPGLRSYLPQPERTVAYFLGFVRRASGNQKIWEADDLASLTRKQAYHTIEALKSRLEQEQKNIAREVPF
ncbi:phage protein GemA/Gp16 family protein [Victivallis vadensis]|uniref:phage protein GemA/Gp16 family protein n=1 Tax=Victivallis vadensis TaxID=172901 RepID=UPI003D01BE5F